MKEFRKPFNAFNVTSSLTQIALLYVIWFVAAPLINTTKLKLFIQRGYYSHWKFLTRFGPISLLTSSKAF